MHGQELAVHTKIHNILQVKHNHMNCSLVLHPNISQLYNGKYSKYISIKSERTNDFSEKVNINPERRNEQRYKLESMKSLILTIYNIDIFYYLSYHLLINLLYSYIKSWIIMYKFKLDLNK